MLRESLKNPKEWSLVTGAAKGLGAEICRNLASKGHNLLVHYNKSRQEAERLAHECIEMGVDAAIIQGDFSSIETTDNFITQLKVPINYYRLGQAINENEAPRIAYLINNVGNYLVESLLSTKIEEWQHLFQTNLYAPIALINAFLPSIKKQQGAIINIGVAGITGIPADIYASSYTATKLALWFATKSFAKALACDGVRVNMVSPGMLQNSVDLNCDIIPMGRPGMLEEVARMVEFLLNRENSYITGQNIEVAGALRL